MSCRVESDGDVLALEDRAQTCDVDRMIDFSQALQKLEEGIPLATIIRSVVEQLEPYLIHHMLVATAGNKSEAAKRLRIDYKTLYRKMHHYADTLAIIEAACHVAERPLGAQMVEPTGVGTRSVFI